MPIPALLAVDDDPGVRAAIQRDLRQHYDEDDTPEDRQFEVLAVDSGAAALDLIARLRQRRQPVALVLYDERMPGMGGVDLLTRVREVSPETKRVLLTAYADTDVAIRGVNRARLDLYLTKPWNPTELFSPLDDLLSAWRAEASHQLDGRALLFGDRWSRESYQLREFLARNRAPYHYHDTATADGRSALSDLVGESWPALPLLVTPDGTRLERPDVQALARHLHLQTRAELERYDLVVVGAGPAGLTSSVYGASEGLRTLLLDRDAPGGQAGLSARIENYLGFPAGLSGRDLTTRAVAQARKFHVEIVSPQAATAMHVEHEYKVLRLADGSEVQASAVVLAMGVQWRTLEVDGLDRFTGAGVYYGASMAEARTCRDETVYVVGGANSAGQAALNFAEFARKVVMLVRGPDLSASMSEYLIHNIGQRDNIEVQPNTCVVGAGGDDRLRTLTLASPDGQGTRTVAAASLYVMIGAAPDTDWLGEVVARDARGYIYTGPDLPRPAGSARPVGWTRSRDPWLLETCVPGVFAAGDVRSGSVKRVASSVGEGAVAIQFVHQYLAGK
jgi:thioredoxin reductase (NADPH)